MLGLGELHVHGGKNREDVGLDDGHDELDGVDNREDGDPHDACQTNGVAGADEHAEEAARQDREGRKADVAGEHVGEESDGEGDEAQERGEGLDDADQNVDREGDASRSKGLNVAQSTHVLHCDTDEIHKGAQSECHGDADGARTRLAAGDDTDDVVEEDEEEHGKQEGTVLVGRLAQVALEDVLADILNHVLNTVHKAATGDQRQTAPGCKEHNQHKNDGDAHPEDVLGQAGLTAAHNEAWEELMNDLVDFLTDARE